MSSRRCSRASRAHDAKLHAFVEVYADDARLAAEAADKAIRSGHAVGPLHGVPIALKDLIDIEGPGHDRRLEGVARPPLAGDRDAGPPA